MAGNGRLFCDCCGDVGCCRCCCLGGSNVDDNGGFDVAVVVVVVDVSLFCFGSNEDEEDIGAMDQIRRR